MKKYAAIGEANSLGPFSMSVESTAYAMMSGQPSREATTNKVIIPSGTESKFEL
jgi:hypothetical protein